MELAKRFEGYRQRVLHEWSMWRHAKQRQQKFARFQQWLQELDHDPPDVLLGANFANYGGVRGHLHAIQKYSTLNIGLAPPDQLISAGLQPFHFKNKLRDQFYEFVPNGLRVAHSHVFPWFVHWCRRRQGDGIRWIHTYHNMYFPEFARGELEPWQQEINEVILNDARHADVRISVSRWQQAYLHQEHGIKTEYIPNGVDVGLCDAADGRRFAQKYQRDNFVLYVGRNDPVKNPADFVRLASRLPEQSFVMIGGDLSSLSLQREWDVEIPDNMTLLDSLSHADVLDAIAASKAVVVTSLREGLPTVVMEAMTLQKPVVVPDDAGCMEVVDGGTFGYVYPQHDINRLKSQTAQAICCEAQTDARERVLNEYDWRAVIRKLDQVYSSC